MARWNIFNGAFYYCIRLLLTIFSYKGTEVLDSLTAWWPVLLIILGVEILLYLLLSKKEQSFIKYDIFSIFFIGVLGSVGIAFYCLLSTGLLDEVRHSIHTTRQTSNIPSGQLNIPESIKKIVVDAGQYPLTIEEMIQINSSSWNI